MREGKKQLAIWLAEARMTRLKALAAEERTTLADILERAITQYQREDTGQVPSTEGFIKAKLDDHEARLSALENHQALSSQPLKAFNRKPKLDSRHQQILDLHAQGASGREIAKQLRVGRHTVRRVLKGHQAQERP